VNDLKARNFPQQYRRISDLDASGVVVSSSLDGIHLEKEEHAKLGDAVVAKAREILVRTARG
jgi:hypothetical protein